jgi:hypothetical protein
MEDDGESGARDAAVDGSPPFLQGCWRCGREALCGICETCAEHCEVQAPADLAQHLAAFDEVIARTPDTAAPDDLVEARAQAKEIRRGRS